MVRRNLAVLFSGGRTSAYMSSWIKDNWMDSFNVKFVFCNTGQEHEETLKFVNKCDKHFNLNLTWIEAKVNPKGVGTSYSETIYEIASRNGEPFEEVVKKYGLPNKSYPHCTRELKIEPFKKWAKVVFGGESYSMALGIRVDEPKRLNQSKTDAEKLYPLAIDNPMNKQMVLDWWKTQPFDLQLPEHLGNCMWCYKKSDRKLYTLAQEYPWIFEFPQRLEDQYSQYSNNGGIVERKIFRRNRSTLTLLSDATASSFIPFIDENFEGIFEDECAEECGSFIKDE